jgi:hypothetical protein
MVTNAEHENILNEASETIHLKSEGLRKITNRMRMASIPTEIRAEELLDTR